MATQTKDIATQEKRAPTAFEQQLDDYLPQIEAALPDHASVERFKRVVITAINQNPELGTADRRSLFTSCVACAQDGLYPDGKEAALVIYNTKNKQTNQFEKKVQYLPMIAGVRKRMRNSGEVLSAVAHVVYSNDHFAYVLGDEERIEHSPALDNRGEPIAAYAIIKLKNGETIREVMPVQEIELARSVSKAAQNGPWKTWWGEMARKTVLRRAAKAAPSSADLDSLWKRDDDQQPDELAIEQAAKLAPPRPTRRQFTDVDPAAAGHEDPDAAYRRAMGGDVIDGEFEEETEDETPEKPQAQDGHSPSPESPNADDPSSAAPGVPDPQEAGIGPAGGDTDTHAGDVQTAATPAVLPALSEKPTGEEITAWVQVLTEKLNGMEDETAVMNLEDQTDNAVTAIAKVNKAAGEHINGLFTARKEALVGA